MSYEETYGRNIGLFSEEEQRIIKHGRAAVAGVGGVGGYQAVALARAGIGAMSIMDPGVFDPPDMNRQYGAMASTLGRNKAEATAEILRDINPYMQLDVYTESAETEADVMKFLENADIVIDAIDYAGFYYKHLLAKCAREKGLYLLTSPIPAFGASLTVFDPKGMTLDEFYGAPETREEMDRFRIPAERVALRELLPQVLLDFIDAKHPFISTNGAAAQLSGALLASEALFILTGKRKREDIITAPEMVHLDLFNRIYKRF